MFRHEVLEGCLTREQKELGFTVVEEDDHFLNLVLKDKVVAVFSATGDTIAAIREAADRIIELMGHKRPDCCHDCAWWEMQGDGRYGYCGYSDKKVLADKMASACQGAKAKSQKPAKHTRTDNKNIYYDSHGNARPNDKVPEHNCKSCGKRLNILQWNSSGNLYMYICRNITCYECDRPQGSYMVLEQMAPGLLEFTVK